MAVLDTSRDDLGFIVERTTLVVDIPKRDERDGTLVPRLNR